MVMKEKAWMFRYFGSGSSFILLGLTASLVFLPLVLPPLPPPPLMLLFIPVAILAVLLFLAMAPSHITHMVV